MKPRFCLVIVGLASFSSAAFSQSILVTEKMFPQLQPILVSALQQSPRMIERNLDLEMAAGDTTVAHSGLYPSLNSYARSLYASEKREDIPGRLGSDKLYYDLSVNQTLFHWGDVRSRARIGDIREKIVQKQYGQGYSGLAQEIRSVYLRLILQKVQLNASTYSQQKAEQALTLAQDRLRNRVIADSEVFPVRINADQAKLGTDRLQASFTETKRQFRLLTGSPAPADDDIPSALPLMMSPEGEVSRMLADFLGQKAPKTFATQVAESQLEIERLNYAITKHALRPMVNLVAGVSQDEQSYTTNLAAKYGLNSRYIGISVTWAIFDGFATRGAIRSSLARVRKLEASYKQLTDDLGINAQEAARQLGFAERQMHIQDQLFDSSENFLKFRKDEFGRGNASDSDVVNAQLGYNRELVNTLQIRADFLLRMSDFIALIAEDPVLTNLPAKYR